ncbi:unnamed protein product [Prunus brigantina]
MAEIPKFIALKSVQNNKYLVYKDESTVELQDILQFSGEDLHSRYARFKVEKDVNLPELVHIKSTYIDKYWRAASQDSSWIVAEADEKEPSKTLWSSTLFKPEVLQEPQPYVNGIYQFRHVATGNLIQPRPGPYFDNALAAEQPTPAQNTAVTVERLPG